MSEKFLPTGVAAEGGELMPTPPKISLKDAHSIRRELGAVYRDMRAKRIDSQDGTRLAYVLNMIRQAFETSELQERLEALERNSERNTRAQH